LEEVWRGDHTESNVYWNEPWVAAGETDETNEYYGGALDVTAGTFTGIYNGGAEGTRVGTFVYTVPDCVAPAAEGDNGGKCKSDRSCTDIAGEGEAAATPQCCGTATTGEGDEAVTITDYCGDGMATTTEETGFTIGNVDYSHTCSAFKMIASSASALAVAYLM
jgi:hypothetical protein